MKKKMKTQVLYEWNGPFHLEERSIPEPGPAEVLIRVRACGVGFTLTNLRAGYISGSLPRIIGHEVGGIVEEVGPMVRTCKRGDRVCVSFYITCGYCKWCISGRETLCENLVGYVGAAIDGGFAEYINVPERNCIHIPEGVSFVDAGITTDAVATNWHVFKERAKTKPNDTVLVVGAGGGVGIHCLQMAKAFGAHVIGVDVSDDKLEIAREYGCDVVINGRDKDMAREVLMVTDGRGVDCAVDMASTNQTINDCIKVLARGGTFVLVGVPRDVKSLNFDIFRLARDEINITGARCATKQEIRESLQLVKHGFVKPAVPNTFRLEDVNEVFKKIDNMELPGRSALIFD
ncbi:alcohol dehydrogenase catalytic domain-containing protein [Chloroflexota bacterium]